MGCGCRVHCRMGARWVSKQVGRQAGRYSRQARKRQARVGRYVTARRIKYGLLTF